jgi:hypothetical protein
MVQGKVLIGGNWPIDMMTLPFFLDPLLLGWLLILVSVQR